MLWSLQAGGTRFSRRRPFFFRINWRGFFQLPGGFFDSMEIQQSGESEMEGDSEYQSMTTALTLITFCKVGHRKNFDWLIERSNAIVNAGCRQISFRLQENIC
jgi:hypothetical protein